MALGVRREPPAQRVQRGPEADGRQDVEERALAGRRVADAAGGDDGEPGLPRERHGAAGPELALARAVPLELHVDPVPAEALDEPLERGPRPVPAPGEAVGGERPVPAPGEADEALDRAVEVVQRRPRLALRRPRLHAGDEAAERPVPGAGFDEERETRAVGEREGGADEGAHARRLRRLVEARRAVDAVHVDEGERGQLEPRRLVDEGLGRRRGFEEAEGAPGGAARRTSRVAGSEADGSRVGRRGWGMAQDLAIAGRKPNRRVSPTAGGAMRARIASNTFWNLASYFCSRSSMRRWSCSKTAGTALRRTNARMISMLTSTASSL